MDDPIHAESPGMLDNDGKMDRKAGAAWSTKNHPTTEKPNSKATVSARKARANTTLAAIPARNTSGTDQVLIGVPGSRNATYIVAKMPRPRTRYESPFPNNRRKMPPEDQRGSNDRRRIASDRQVHVRKIDNERSLFPRGQSSGAS